MIRIVKLSFKPEHREDFIRFLDIHKDKIRHFPGCKGLVLLNDIMDRDIFFTYSHWNSGDDLENYRSSELFTGVWAVVKPWFREKPEAWSVEEMGN